MTLVNVLPPIPGEDEELVTGHCTLGALDTACLELGYSNHDEALAAGAVRQVIGITGVSLGGVAGWNDAKDRTEAEVLDALRHAAKDLRNSVNEG